MQTARLKAYLMLLAVAIIWGVASPVIKYTLQAFDPLFFLTYRFGISTILALIIFIFTGVGLPKNPKTIFYTFLFAFSNSVVALGFLFFGMENTTVLDASLITLVTPLIVTLAGVHFLNERVTKREKFGMSLAMLGTLITIVEPLIFNGHNALKLSGNLMVLGYVLTTAINMVILKKLLRENVKPITLTNLSFIVGFITLLPILTIRSPLSIWTEMFDIPFIYHVGVFYMAIISGTLAFWLSNKAQKTIEISEQSVFSYLYPIFALPIAVVWLGEKITPIFIIGAVVILIGVAIAEIKKRRSK